ncbi:hypothetical protein [Bacillus alkalisoli]|uniref:hypothetical protein n=1 Tax=Bacillus alkalisoli TaxID=2011008 RepID=UPI000C239EB5|nr:hypothetical protein [Bacillus alkalisoli]
MLKKTFFFSCMFVVLTTIVLLSFVYFSTPIAIYGMAENYKDDDASIIYQIENNGKKELVIQELYINDEKKHTNVTLGISYDSIQYVQEGTNNSNIIFHTIDEKAVLPKINYKNVIEVIELKNMTPISYGIRIMDYQQPIDTISIKYKYYGIPITKKYNVSNWNHDSN